MSPDLEEAIVKYTVVLAVLGTIFATGIGMYVRYNPEICFLCFR